MASDNRISLEITAAQKTAIVNALTASAEFYDWIFSHKRD
jgi:hypothetical protein